MQDELKQIFIDGISHINFVNGMVRLTIGTLIPNDDNTVTPEFKDEYRIIMPLNSFLAAFTSQKQLMDQLEENKIISPNGSAENPIIPDVVK
jgi:hypothetical protein